LPYRCTWRQERARPRAGIRAKKLRSKSENYAIVFVIFDGVTFRFLGFGARKLRRAQITKKKKGAENVSK
jgi:hypothetical protein